MSAFPQTPAATPADTWPISAITRVRGLMLMVIGRVPATSMIATTPRPAVPCRGNGLLTWGFTMFNGLRIVAYLPTLQAIWASGQSDQHALLTWLIFFGANGTMSLWLHEQNGHRMNRAIVINGINTLMCAAICLLIAWTRLMPHP